MCLRHTEDTIEAEELLEELDDYKLLHGFLRGVLIQSATKAKNLLRWLLCEKVIQKEEAAEQARQFSDFFKHPENSSFPYLIHNGIKALFQLEESQ